MQTFLMMGQGDINIDGMPSVGWKNEQVKHKETIPLDQLCIKNKTKTNKDE